MAERDIWRRRETLDPRREYRRTGLAVDYDTTAPLYGERGFGITPNEPGPRYAGATGGAWMEGDSESWRRNQLYGDDEQRSFNDLWQDAYGPQASSIRGGDRYDQAPKSYRGIGPTGYRRTDERIREDVCECLTDDEYVDASNIEVTVKECEVNLSGTINSRAEKRRVEELIERISGVKDVQNSLRVVAERRVDERVTTSVDSNRWPRH